MQSLPERLTGIARKLWTPALIAYAITGLVAVGAFVSTLLLARIAGPAVIGAYALAMSTAHMLASVAVLGLDRIVVREVGGDLRTGETGRARAVVRAFALTVALSAVAVALAWLSLLGLTPLSSWIDGDTLALGFAAASGLIWPLQRLGRATLRATGAPLRSQILELVPTLGFMLAMLLAFQLGHKPTAPQAVLLMVAGQFVAGCLAWAWLAPTLRSWRPDSPRPDRRLLLAGLPAMGIIFVQIFSDWFVLAKISAVAGSADVGAFRVALQVTSIVTTLVATTELYVGARLAGDFRVGRPDLAWRRHRRASLLLGAITVPPLLVFVFLPELLLGLLFGPDFRIAATALAIMAIGQLVVVARGPMGAMLSMSGNERIMLWLSIGGLAAAVAAAFLLIPRYGLTGAAIAQIIPIVLRSVAGWLIVRRIIPREPGAPAPANNVSVPDDDPPPG